MLTLQQIQWGLSSGEEIIKDISLTIQPGRLTVVTGPNGGGKTSIAKLTAGLYSPSQGRIFLDGTDITDLDITGRARHGIAYAFQQPVYFKGLLVRDLLEIAAETTLSEKTLLSLFEKVGLSMQDYVNRPMDNSLSGGEIKRIEIATLLARRQAKILIFDEPEAGIDLWSFASLVSVFKGLKKEENRALLVISHQERILEIADEIIVIADGRVRTAGNRETILPRLLADEV